MISQHRQVLNDNNLHTFSYKGSHGVEIMAALSLSNHYQLEPQLYQQLLSEAQELYQTTPTLPPLFARYIDSIEDIQEKNLNTKQIIAIYATLMKVKVKEFTITSKNQLFCTNYIPTQYQKSICVFSYANKYIPLVKTHQMQGIMATEDLLQKFQSTENRNYEFDTIALDQLVYNQQQFTTPEKPFVRKHKKSLSEHQIFEFQKYQDQKEESPPQHNCKLFQFIFLIVFFSQAKEQTNTNNYEFPPSKTQEEEDQDQEEYQFDKNDFFNCQSPIKHNGKVVIFTGKLKFFDEQKNYGFIIMDEDKSDIFVHYDDLQKAGVNKELLKTAKQGSVIRFQFQCMSYVGKYKKSRKAVDLKLLNNPYVNNYRGQQ